MVVGRRAAVDEWHVRTGDVRLVEGAECPLAVREDAELDRLASTAAVVVVIIVPTTGGEEHRQDAVVELRSNRVLEPVAETGNRAVTRRHHLPTHQREFVEDPAGVETRDKAAGDNR